MIKRILKIFIIIVLVIVIAPILFYYFYSYQASLRYIDDPGFIYNQKNNKITYAEDPKSLIISLIKANEYFNGYVSLKRINFENDKVEIRIRNDSTGDDSIWATEDYIIAEKKEKGWTIVHHKTHWECRSIIFHSWTTSACS